MCWVDSACIDPTEAKLPIISFVLCLFVFKYKDITVDTSCTWSVKEIISKNCHQRCVCPVQTYVHVITKTSFQYTKQQIQNIGKKKHRRNFTCRQIFRMSCTWYYFKLLVT